MELSNEKKYVENINRVYGALNNKNGNFDVVESMSSVPASIKLTETGNVLYVKDGVLRVLPVRYKDAIKGYCERNGLVKSEAINENTVSVSENISEVAIATSNLVPEM